MSSNPAFKVVSSSYSSYTVCTKVMCETTPPFPLDATLSDRLRCVHPSNYLPSHPPRDSCFCRRILLQPHDRSCESSCSDEDDDPDPRTEDEYREPSLGSDDDDDDDVVSTSLTRSPSIARRCASPCLQPRPPATFGARAIATLNDDRLVSCEFIHSRPGTMTLSTGRYRCSYSLPLPLTFPPALVSLPLV